MNVHWPHHDRQRPLCRPVLVIAGEATAWLVTDDRTNVTCPVCLKAMNTEPEQRHPCCRAHEEESAEPCTCDEWWAREALDTKLFSEIACKSCGSLTCDGGEHCCENDIEHVRDERDRTRALNRTLRDRFYELRQRLMVLNGLEPDKRAKPTVEELVERLVRG